MLHPKMLNAPRRRLLLTFIVTAGMAATINTASPRTSSRLMPGHRPAATARSRARQTIDYSQIEGVQRWGLNE